MTGKTSVHYTAVPHSWRSHSVAVVTPASRPRDQNLSPDLTSSGKAGRQFTVENLGQPYILVSSSHLTTHQNITNTKVLGTKWQCLDKVAWRFERRLLGTLQRNLKFSQQQFSVNNEVCCCLQLWAIFHDHICFIGRQIKVKIYWHNVSMPPPPITHWKRCINSY